MTVKEKKKEVMDEEEQAPPVMNGHGGGDSTPSADTDGKSSTKEVIQEFVLKVQGEKVVEQRRIYSKLRMTLERLEEPLPDQAVRLLLKLVVPTALFRYQQKESHRLAGQLINCLSSLKPTATMKLLCEQLSVSFLPFSTGSTTASISKAALLALKWLVRCASSDQSVDESNISVMVDALLNTCTAICDAELTSQQTTHAARILRRLFMQRADLLEMLWAQLHRIDLSSAAPKHLCLICMFLFPSSNNSQKWLEFAIDIYVKVALTGKTAVSPAVLKYCGCGIDSMLKSLDRRIFEDKVVPSVKKALLRNPELVMPAISSLLDQLRIDLSFTAMDLLKPIAAQMKSLNAEAGEEAASAVGHLARQCSDVDVLAEMINYVFSFYNGSEGKLTTSVQRLAVLHASGRMAVHAVSGAEHVDRLSALAFRHYRALLNDEVHEGTIEVALSEMAAWGKRLSKDVPRDLIELVKHGLQFKGLSPNVKLFYLVSIVEIFRQSNLLPYANEYIEELKQAVNGSAKQPANIPLAKGALAATVVLLRLHRIDINRGDNARFTPLFNAVLSGGMFFTDPFLKSMENCDAMLLAECFEHLFLDRPVDLSADSSYPPSLCRALFLCCVWPVFSVRTRAYAAVKKVLNLLEGSKFASAMLREAYSSLSEGWVDQMWMESAVLKTADQPTDDSTPNVAERKVPSRKIVEQALRRLTMLDDLMNESEAIDVAVSCLLACSSDVAASNESVAWKRMIMKLCSKAIPGTLFENEMFADAILHEFQIVENAKTASNMLAVVTRCTYPSATSKLCLAYVDAELASLQSERLLEVTDVDIAIWQTPEGTLYNTAIIDALDSTTEEKNIKRESKAYSYKEQMAALKLQKELEEKRRKEGKPLPPKKLTPRQQEAKKQELEKEKAIRNDLQTLYDKSNRTLMLVKSVASTNALAARDRVSVVVEHVVPLFQSLLIADLCADVWVTLGQALARDEQNLCVSADLLAYCILRLARTVSRLNKDWTDESLSSQTIRVLKQLTQPVKDVPGAIGTKKTGSSETADDDEEEEVQTELACDELEGSDTSDAKYSTPMFVYLYPLLKAVLIDRPTLFGSAKEELRVQALDFIETQLDFDFVTETDFSILPLESLCEILLELISDSDAGRVQQSAGDAALALATLVEHQSSSKTAVGALAQSVVEACAQSLTNSKEAVREDALKMLVTMGATTKLLCADESHSPVVVRVWIARCDVSESLKELADKLWEIAQLQFKPQMCHDILRDLMAPVSFLRQSSSKALSAAWKLYPDQVCVVLEEFDSEYKERSTLKAPVLDEVGRVIREAEDEWEAREGIALGLQQLTSHLADDNVDRYFDVLVPDALNDRNGKVRDLMLTAATMAIQRFGQSHLDTLLPKFESHLDDLPDTKSFDSLRQSLVIILGSLAGHLDQSDPKIRPIVARLIETLSTPSQQVQEAVARCLPPLVPAIRDQASDLSGKLMWLLLEADNYGERRGAAYGLAGMVKGLGMVSLKQLQIMTTLQEALLEKKKVKHREGALLALQMLCGMLGKLFEPYVVQVLPNLLLCFGDQDQHVRKAAEDCAKVVMEHLSVHGVKLVLPALLKALEEDSWRTKCGSVELLGAMAYCAPKQLSSCLPSVVPKLMEVLTDTHSKVHKAGVQALTQIKSVIRNPEIQALSDTILEALVEPTKNTSKCLATLGKTKFVHQIDAASLALVMPVIYRAFEDRSSETRRVAGAIVANIYAAAEQKDIEPYLDRLLPGLQKSLMDPMPEIRAVAAKALGAMVGGGGSGGGEVNNRLRDELLPWLKEKLVSPVSSVDRIGAAQGLSEVLGGLGEDQLAAVMPDIIRTTESDQVDSVVRDGYITMYVYLPTVFGKQFAAYLTRVVPSILKALADESEFVRETALRAGQRLINTYADTSKTLLLPQLERGLFDENWRIRYSSIQLLGDFLFRISGVTGKMSVVAAGEDESFGTETAQRAIMRELGTERRNRVFAGLYIARSDVALQCRQAAAHVWKVVVMNTPRTIKEILTTLFQLLLGCLASSSHEKQQVAARCLGELVRKMGERILIDVIPVLERGLRSPDSDQRQGVCIALSEIVANTTKDVIVLYQDNLVPTVRQALFDPLADVRVAAASTFDALHAVIGAQALDEIIMPLLDQLEDEEVGERTLDGLRNVMALKGKVMLPYLIPKLAAPPVNTVALSRLASAAGDALSRHLSKILDSLIDSLTDKIDTENEQKEKELCLDVLLSVNDDQGLANVVETLIQRTTKGQLNARIAASTLLAAFCQRTTCLLNDLSDQLIRGTLGLYVDESDRIVDEAITALSAVTKLLDQREQMESVPGVKHMLTSQLSPITARKEPLLKGFCQSKGLAPLLPMLREGILTGNAELKERSAETLREVIRMSDEIAWKPHVTNVTGPLIRVLGDRYPPPVKIAILSTIAALLDKVKAMLRPFLPQLQSTFLKALHDPTSRDVRLNAGRALSRLISIHPKPDTVTLEMVKQIKNNEDASIIETFLVTLRGLLERVGDKLAEETREQLVEILRRFVTDQDDDSCRRAGAAAFAVAVVRCAFSDERTSALLDEIPFGLADPANEWTDRHGGSIALQIALKSGASRLFDVTQPVDRIRDSVQAYISSDRVPVCLAGLRAAGYLLLHQFESGGSSAVDTQLLTAVVKAINHQTNEVKQLSAAVVHTLAKAAKGTPFDASLLKIIVPMMVNGTKEKNSAVRYACEQNLCAIFKLHETNDHYETYLSELNAGQREALTDVYTKSLLKMARAQQSQPSIRLDTIEGDPLDDTVRV